MSKALERLNAALSTREEDETIILADISSSMLERDVEGHSRYELLCQALKSLTGARLIAFNDQVELCDQLPRPSGGTLLEPAIVMACEFQPVRTVIISDGEPWDPDQSKEAIKNLTGRVDVIYCGASDNKEARSFLKSLASKVNGGYYETGDQVEPTKQLAPVIAGLLGTGK